MFKPTLRFMILACCVTNGPAFAWAQPKTAPVQDEAVRKLSQDLSKLKLALAPDWRAVDASLYYVDFSKSALTPATLAELRPILAETKVPLSLYLNSRTFKDADLAPLENLACIRRLVLAEPVTDAGLEHLRGLGNLEELTLWSDNVTNAGLAHLSKLTKLRNLSVSGKKVTLACCVHLADLELEEFSGIEVPPGRTALYQIGDAQLAQIKVMTKMRKLEIGGSKLTDAGLADLANMTGLRELQISAPRPGGGDLKITKAGLARLAALKNLERLTMIPCKGIRGDGLASLAEMPSLRSLTIAANSKVWQSPAIKMPANVIDAEVARQIANAKNLQYLHLGQADDAVLEPIGGMKSLRTLELGSTKVTEAGVAHLGGLTDLERVNLSYTPQTDDGLKHLAGMKKLKSLNLAKCQIEGPGLAHLAAMKQLEELHLEYNPLTEEALPHLLRLTGLRDLNLTQTKIGDDAALALKKALPKARIRDAWGEEVLLVQPAQRKVEDLSKAKPDFTLTAIQYYAEFQKDEKAAAKKYDGKIVELIGVVAGHIGLDKGEPYLGLAAKEKSDYSGVLCFTADPRPWLQHAPGQTVKIRGRQNSSRPDPVLFGRFVSGAALVDCAIVEASKNPAIPLTVADLEDQLAERMLTTQKYRGRPVWLTGEISKLTIGEDGGVNIRLKSGPKFSFECWISAGDRKLARDLKLKVGDTVTFYGKCNTQVYATNTAMLILPSAVPIKKEGAIQPAPRRSARGNRIGAGT